MKEEFLHYIWKTKQFSPVKLTTHGGETLEIIQCGEHNKDAGPDFFNAQLKIGNMRWSGNVEIHVKASDWIKHRHQEDEAYNNVILHVVYENDAPVFSHAGKQIPTLVLRGLLDERLYKNYLLFEKSTNTIPCANSISQVSSLEKTGWLDRLLAERLERKISILSIELEQNGSDWEETFYRHLARQFGMKVNAEPFQLLAMAVPLRMLARQQQLLQAEALLFGQSGFLEEQAEDVYVKTLRREYELLQRKFSLSPMPLHQWKFMRLRPNNFPTLRIAQFAGLFFRQPQLFRVCMETSDVSELKKLLQVPSSAYWNTHYRFGKISTPGLKQLGEQALETILINTVVPFKFLYGRNTGNEFLVQDALSLLEKISAEKNCITREWENLGMKANSAAETQALLELRKNYCEKKRCLECSFGQTILERRGKGASGLLKNSKENEVLSE